MHIVKRITKPFVPSLIWQFLRARHRAHCFPRAMRCLIADPDSALSQGSRAIDNLRYGWDNEGWAAWDEYQKACGREVRDSAGPILECGSGLSTLVAGVLAQHHEKTIWCLEHNPMWAARVQRRLDDYGISSVRVCVKPLRDYGDFTWYEPPLAEMPETFALVLCDGPPADLTPGGRSGMLPVMHERLTPDCVIMMDDAAREHETALAKQWASALGAEPIRHGLRSPYFRIGATRVAGTGVPPAAPSALQA